MKKAFIILIFSIFLFGCKDKESIPLYENTKKYNPAEYECIVDHSVGAMYSKNKQTGIMHGSEYGCSCQQIADFDMRHLGNVNIKRMEEVFLCKSSDYKITNTTNGANAQKIKNLLGSELELESNLTFHGYECTADCSGHEAGYEWAERKGIYDIDDCGGNSRSFIEGCWAYVEENY